MVTALKGAVILDEGGGMMRYKPVCDHCDAEQPGTVYTQAPSGSTLQSGFMCYKCQTYSDVRIKG